MAAKAKGGTNNLATTHPDLVLEWHPTKNAGTSLYDFTRGAIDFVWWVCSRGHEWQAPIYSRVAGNGCPYCAGQRVWIGYNDMATTHPDLAAQWHPAKNGEKTPNDVIAGTGKKVWWLCDLGHEWEASGAHRVNGQGCPYCAGQRVWIGYNDMATTHPALAAQWHPAKNGDLTPFSVMATSGRNAWWRCDHEHEWRSTPNNRRRETGCPYCAGQRVWIGYNDMATTHPDLAAQWHPAKNGSLSPRDVIAGTNKKIWWRCSKDHEWQATGGARVGRETGCPVCSGRTVWAGYNDMATTHPDLAAQWHPTKNGSLSPRDVTAGTNKKIWWRCSKDHEWSATGPSRVVGSGCPVCSGRTVWAGYNDMATTHPSLALEWHPTKNGNLSPREIIAGANKKFWWACPEGHEWMATGNSRASGRGCPACAKSGFDQTKPAVLYFLISNEYRARKVGITNVGTTRLADFARSGWATLLLREYGSGAIVREVEGAIFAWLRNDLRLPQYLGREEMGRSGGWTETFSMEGPSDAEVIARIEEEFARLEAEG